ncbi:MAG: hypothetical protein KDH20_01845 [Rhodocyclaceae bacterium]|nr:hypothetical protein [Rhodocyclaceae bacterium]
MGYRIEETATGVTITVAQVGDARDSLLAAFSACRDGRCQCPTAAYGELEGLDVQEVGDGLVLDLRVRPGGRLEVDEIRRCLDFTLGQAGLA